MVSNHFRSLNYRSWWIGKLLAEAFAADSPSTVQRFHPSSRNRNAPQLSLSIMTWYVNQPQQKPKSVVFIPCCKIQALWTHLKRVPFLKVSNYINIITIYILYILYEYRYIKSINNSNYERFKCNNSMKSSSSRNYRGCWHLTCPRFAFVEHVYIGLILITIQRTGKH